MAELILTPEEKAANTWLELDDAVVGRLVKYTATQFKSTTERSAEQAGVWWWSAALLLVGLAVDANADSFVQTLHAYQRNGEALGDFRITIERVPTDGGLAATSNEASRPDADSGEPKLTDAAQKTPGSDATEAVMFPRGVLEELLSDAAQFLFRRMRLLGIVPAFYAGAAHSEATGAPTGNYAPDAALQSLASDLQEQWVFSEACVAGIMKGIALNLVDVDLLPPDVAAAVAKGINQGCMTAQSSYQVM